MTKKELKQLVDTYKNYKDPTPDQLNQIRNAIFDSFDNGQITEAAKKKLLTELYEAAAKSKKFFLKVMDRKAGLPKDEADEERIRQEEEDAANEDDDYSYSYDESYDDEEEEEDDDEEIDTNISNGKV